MNRIVGFVNPYGLFDDKVIDDPGPTTPSTEYAILYSATQLF